AALPAPAGESVERRCAGRLEGGEVPELGDGIVAQAVQADIEEAVQDPASRAPGYLTMSANSSGSRLAPPTRAPSISGCAMNSLMFPAVTLPPYWLRNAARAFFATVSSVSPNSLRRSEWPTMTYAHFSAASMGPLTSPVKAP